MNKVYALAIVAHPDDETFLFSGTSLKFAEEGKNIAVVCATRGEKGTDRLGRNLTPQEMAEERAQELTAAAKLIKRCVRWFTSGCLYVSRDRHNQRSEKRWRSRKNGRPNGGPGTKALRLGNGTRSRQRK